MSLILQFDEFAPDAAEVRAAVVQGEFSTETGPDGAHYTGISKHAVPQWYDLISRRVGRKIVPRLSCFRLNLEGERPHSWVHSDDICAKFASVLYLNRPEQCRGGTAFWKHKQLSLERLPSREWLADRKIEAEPFYAWMNREWKNQLVWEQASMIAMRWNRFITYPTYLFHSRFPFEAFGKGPEDGRLIWICFYDIEDQL
jgi:hypothetical protein